MGELIEDHDLGKVWEDISSSSLDQALLSREREMVGSEITSCARSLSSTVVKQLIEVGLVEEHERALLPPSKKTTNPRFESGQA